MNKANQKGLIVLAVVALGGYFIFKNMKKSGGNQMDDKDGRGDGSGTNTGGTGTGGAVTSSLNFSQMATDLFDAFDGYGTKNSIVVNTMKKLNNQADFDKLSEVYGVRKVSSGNFNIFVNDFTGNLTQTLRNELGSGYITDINTHLSSKGIKTI